MHTHTHFLLLETLYKLMLKALRLRNPTKKNVLIVRLLDP